MNLKNKETIMTLRKMTAPILGLLLLGFTVTLPACDSTNGEKPRAFTGQSETRAPAPQHAGPPSKNPRNR